MDNSRFVPLPASSIISAERLVELACESNTSRLPSSDQFGQAEVPEKPSTIGRGGEIVRPADRSSTAVWTSTLSASLSQKSAPVRSMPKGFHFPTFGAASLGWRSPLPETNTDQM